MELYNNGLGPKSPDDMVNGYRIVQLVMSKDEEAMCLGKYNEEGKPATNENPNSCLNIQQADAQKILRTWAGPVKTGALKGFTACSTLAGHAEVMASIGDKELAMSLKSGGTRYYNEEDMEY